METINIQYISVVTQRLCSPFPHMLPFSCCCPIKTWSFSLHLSSVSCLKGGTVCTPQLSPKVWRSLHVHNTDSMQFLMCSFKGLLKANGLCLPAGSIKSQNWKGVWVYSIWLGSPAFASCHVRWSNVSASCGLATHLHPHSVHDVTHYVRCTLREGWFIIFPCSASFEGHDL